MEYLLCYLWAVFLAAAIPCLSAWQTWPRRLSVRDIVTNDPVEDDIPSILWLTPACAAALDECAEPAILAEASETKIKTLLEARFHKPPKEDFPKQEHYRTWPEQAAMLAAGRYEALRAWQNAWQEKDTTSRGEKSRKDGVSSIDRSLPGRDRWFIVSLLLLIGALISALVSSRLQICNCEKTGDCVSRDPVSTPPPSTPSTTKPPLPPPAPKPVRLELATDAIFDYKMPGTYHPAVLRSHLRNLFQRFEGIQIVRVEGHTDPIGSTADNKKLGRMRTETVLKAIGELITKAKAGQFANAELPQYAVSAGPQAEDVDVWRYCFDRFQLKVAEPQFRPLRNLSASLNPDKRPSCTAENAKAGTRYPACAGPYDRTIPRDLKVYARQAENFREMTSCLSPMRHVVVVISYDRQVPIQP